MRDRAFLIYYARVILAEAQRRRHDPRFVLTLLRWAANARREAAAMKRDWTPQDLFGSAA